MISQACFVTVNIARSRETNGAIDLTGEKENISRRQQPGGAIWEFRNYRRDGALPGALGPGHYAVDHYAVSAKVIKAARTIVPRLFS